MKALFVRDTNRTIRVRKSRRQVAGRGDMRMKSSKPDKIQGLRKKGRKPAIVFSFNDPKITNEKITTKFIFQIKTC